MSTEPKFLDDLRALCLRHGVELSVSMYEGLEIAPLKPNEEPLQFSRIDDWSSGSGVPDSWEKCWRCNRLHLGGRCDCKGGAKCR